MKKIINSWSIECSLLKFDLKMKLSALLIICSLFQLSANNTYSQATKLTMDMDKVTVNDVIREIESLSEFKFLYNRNEIDLKRVVSVKVNKKRISKILSNLFINTDIDFDVYKKQIILKKDKNKNVSEIKEELIQSSVSGTVKDASGVPLPGANILEKGTTNGTQTDFDGKFSLTLNSENTTLIVSYLGFFTQEVVLDNQTSIEIMLQEDTAKLDEVVVVGYGTQKKSDLTGAVSSVKNEQLTAFPSVDATQALQGRAAGVQITSTNGAPGSDYNVRIRGGTSINASNNPIFVVDGLVGGALPPPEDIASIEVLKDASATAIYGSRGANGVVLVTTKRGGTGKPQINISTSYTTQEVINTIDMLNADQFVDYVNDAGISYSPFAGPDGETYSTNWQNEIFRTGSIQNHNLSISGGNDDVKYYVSGILYDQSGIIESSDFQRFSVTSNLDLKASDNLNFGANLFVRRSNSQGVNSQEVSGGSGQTGIISSALLMEPDRPIFDSNGNFVQGNISIPVDNPISQIQNNTIESEADRFQMNLFGEYAFIPELKIKSTFGMTSSNNSLGNFTNSNTIRGSAVGGIASILNTKSTSVLSETYLTFDKDFEDHNITAVAGYSYQKQSDELSYAAGQGFISNSLSYRNLGAASTPLNPRSSILESEIASYYGRLNYSYNGKYLLQVNGRYDGASNFSKNNKWAFFPSVALAWNVSKEPFMSSVEFINNLKIRTSYGLTGNQAITPYSSLATILGDGGALAIQGGEQVNALLPNTIANNNLTWETTTQTNIGIDLGLFKNRLNISADYYTMITEDLLFRQPLDQVVGYADLFFTTNFGEVENKGLEFNINTRNLVGDFTWTTDFNIAFNRNKIKSLPDNLDILYDQTPEHLQLGDPMIHRVGSPVGSFYGWVYGGVLNQDTTLAPGSISGLESSAGGEFFVDVNNDGVVDADDRTIIGDPNPDFIWGLTNDFSYKGFNLNIFFQASHGNDIFNLSLMETDLGDVRGNASTALLKRWTPTNTNTNVPAANASRTLRSSSRWIDDGSYVRLKNISLGYTFPESVLTSIKMRSLRVYVSGQNLLTFTDYKGFDPEVSYSGRAGNSTSQGLDYGTYPNVKGFTFGVNIGL